MTMSNEGKGQPALAIIAAAAGNQFMTQDAEQPEVRHRNAKIAAANRAEVTALLIRGGCNVYRPEADCEGEELVVRFPSGKLLDVRLRGRPVVDWRRYGKHDLWMLFPCVDIATRRQWYLLPHDHFYTWVESRHGGSMKWASHWSFATTSDALLTFLADWVVKSSPEAIFEETILPSYGVVE